MTEKLYGDEESGYKFLARDLTPEQAREILRINLDDGIYMQMPENRRLALHQRLDEGGLSFIVKE